MLPRSDQRTWIFIGLGCAAILCVLIFPFGYQWHLNNLPQTYYDHTRNAASPEVAVREIVSQDGALQKPRTPVFYGRYETEIGSAIFYSPSLLRYDLFAPWSENLPQSLRRQPGQSLCYAIPQPDNRGWKLSFTDQNCVAAYPDQPNPYLHCSIFPDFDVHMFVLFGRVNTSLVSAVEFRLDTGEMVDAHLTNGFFLVFPKRNGLSVRQFEDALATRVAHEKSVSFYYSPLDGQLVIRDHAAQVILQQPIKDLCSR
jgi:hypothetical protein